MHQPVILCGLGRVGWPVLEYLQAAGMTVVVVNIQPRPDDPRLDGVRYVQGDCRQQQVLAQVGLDDARGVFILTSDDLVNISATLLVRHLHPDIRIVVRLFNQNLMVHLGKSVPNVCAVSVSALTAPVLALTALTGEALGTFAAVDGALRQVAEVVVGAEDELTGRTIGDLTARHRLLPLAHLPAQGAERFLLHVAPATPLAAGDRLVLCGQPEHLAPLLRSHEEELLTNLRWAGWLRRSWRIAARTFGEIDLPVKIATCVLVLVVVGSTLVFHLGIKKSLADGLFRTITLIATAATDLHEKELTEDWQKVFVSLMRLVGTALIAAFTAIFTNYLLRARLGKALEMRRIPDSGHVVVCGLGGVGYRVVEELRRRREQVVVIEKTSECRFMAAARRQGATVIVSDATLPEVLRQANVAQARAVVAATENQLANLEIALLVRELNPRVRVVLRVADPHLARTLREAANVRLALSTTALAAPAIVAALFGDRVPQLFLIAGKALAVVELAVQADDLALAGQQVGELCAENQLLAVGLATADGKAPSVLADHRLGAGDRLTAILALSDLAHLVLRQRSQAAPEEMPAAANAQA